MFEIDNTLAISAPLGRVWRVVSDLEHYRDWHPFVSLLGEPILGSAVELEHKVRIGSLPPINAEAKIVQCEPHASIAWRLGTRGLMEIEEGFELHKTEYGTDVRHRMRCSGIASLIGLPWVRRRMLKAVTVTNTCLSSFVAKGTTIARYAPLRGRPIVRGRR